MWNKNVYHARVEKRSLGLAALLWLCFGFFGAHRFYLRRMVSANVVLILAALAAGRMATLMKAEHERQLIQNASAFGGERLCDQQGHGSFGRVDGVEQLVSRSDQVCRLDSDNPAASEDAAPSSTPTAQYMRSVHLSDKEKLALYTEIRSWHDLLNWLMPVVLLIWILDGLSLKRMVDEENAVRAWNKQRLTRVRLDEQTVGASTQRPKSAPSYDAQRAVMQQANAQIRVDPQAMRGQPKMFRRGDGYVRVHPNGKLV
ncbi:hypothetical protein FVE85_2282 [Porphyridium purpureum]|uniref:TM2 domain-containing protein n=1 Tax=Porphyridium purpureum TaxID=35688 RepID=A0A5J4Z096_PORPP|nr:hypothetical protein FVE85_2282 [Porphyridium purpureum]|eukprot:POR0572..scf209_3